MPRSQCCSFCSQTSRAKALTSRRSTAPNVTEPRSAGSRPAPKTLPRGGGFRTKIPWSCRVKTDSSKGFSCSYFVYFCSERLGSSLGGLVVILRDQMRSMTDGWSKLCMWRLRSFSMMDSGLLDCQRCVISQLDYDGFRSWVSVLKPTKPWFAQQNHSLKQIEQKQAGLCCGTSNQMLDQLCLVSMFQHQWSSVKVTDLHKSFVPLFACSAPWISHGKHQRLQRAQADGIHRALCTVPKGANRVP